MRVSSRVFVVSSIAVLLTVSRVAAAQEPAVPAPRLVPPRLIERTVLPEYPEAARSIGLEGDVTFQARVDATGAVVGVSVLKVPVSGAGFEDAVSAAVKTWRFEPARLGDKAVTSTHVDAFSFGLVPSRTWPGSRVYSTSSADVWRAVRESVRALGLPVDTIEKTAQVLETRRTDFGTPPRRPAPPELQPPYRPDGFRLWVFVPPGIEPGRVHVRASFDAANTRRWVSTPDRGTYDIRLDNAARVVDWFVQRLSDALGVEGEPLKSGIRQRADQLKRLGGGDPRCLDLLAEYGPPVDREPEAPSLSRNKLLFNPFVDAVVLRHGETWVDALVLEDGSSQDARRSSERPDLRGAFDSAAANAARRWVFTPARLDNCPVPHGARIKIRYEP